MAPPYVNENPNIELTEEGLLVAEDEKRDSVTESYEAEAFESDEVEETLDDIAYPEQLPDTGSPELAAIREDRALDE
ncbi:MAG: hypothetical protein H7Y36_10480 [Armatimonadetes bacterium]|nr:hypothetical protein [Akkermansiaceae bacterium]